jgi:hypothetical protein
MPDQLTDDERKILSYCYRGVNKLNAEEKIGAFFGMKPFDVRTIVEKLRRQGLIVESKGVAGVNAYQASPIKVRSAMIDERIVEQLKAAEQGGKAGGFKRHTFDPDTGALTTGEKKIEKKPADLGFDIN